MLDRTRFEHEIASLLQPRHHELALETASHIAAVPPRCVAEGYDLVAKARSLDGPKLEQTKAAAPYMAEARKYFRPLLEAYKKRVPGLGFGLRTARDRKEHELGRTFVAHAVETVELVEHKARIGATIGGYWDMLDTIMKGARYFFELAADEGLSKEIPDAPVYRPELLPNDKLGLRPCEIRMVAWLRRYRRSFEEGAKKYRVTALAAAGAIAWEAVEHPMFFVLRAVGPGKAHTRTSPIPGLGSDDTLAKQIETAGYVSKKSTYDRERHLRMPRGAIEYVSAMMGAAADLADQHGFSIRKDPAVLTAFYQAYDLDTWKAHLAKKKAKGQTTFQAIDSMAKWTAAKLPMLRLGVGAKA